MNKKIKNKGGYMSTLEISDGKKKEIIDLSNAERMISVLEKAFSDREQKGNIKIPDEPDILESINKMDREELKWVIHSLYGLALRYANICKYIDENLKQFSEILKIHEEITKGKKEDFETLKPL
jgi:hypothetical protein